MTLLCLGRQVEASLPADVPLVHLMPDLLRLAVPADGEATEDPDGWTAVLPHGVPFTPWTSLAQAGVGDGDVIAVDRVQPSPGPAGAEAALPHQRSLAALPRYRGVASRIGTALSAAAGRHVPPAGDALPVRAGQVSRASLTLTDNGSPLGRLRRSWLTSDYLNRLDEAIQAPRLRRCVTIAVVSPKGGVGKTTITALLGGVFALLRRDRIVAVDTNPDFGSLGRSLTPAHGVYVDDLVEVLDSPQLTVTELDTHLARGPHGMMVVPAPTDPARMALLDQSAYTRVIRRLQEMVGMVMLDCGTGLHDPAQRAALETADQLLLVTDSDPATASLVAEAGLFLRSTSVPMWLVVNRMPASGSRLRIAALEEYLPFAQGLVVVPAHESAARRVASGTFDWREAPGGWARAVRQLAAVLAAAWPDQGVAV